MANKIKSKHVSLVDRVGALKKDEVQCPICWSILIEPVSLPCKHCLCLVCYKKHVEETSLQCPCCRMRLSIWSRKAFRENSLVDEPLWARIQKEFPKLVQTRLCGGDSQELPDEDFTSVFEREEVLNEEDVLSDKESSPKKPLVRDGDFCPSNGEIRRELEQLMKTHQEDIENQRLMEERESANLIRQLELEEQEKMEMLAKNNSIIETDSQLAKKLEEEEKNIMLAEISAKRKLFTEKTDSESNSIKKSAAGTKLISEWTVSQPLTPELILSSSTSFSSSDTTTPKHRSWIETPKRNGKRSSLTSLSSQSSKKMKNTTKLNSICTKTKPSSSQKSNSQQNSQNSILSYLVNSQSNFEEDKFSPKVNKSPQPCSSASVRSSANVTNSSSRNCTVTSDASYSAFSPTKLISGKCPIIIPGELVYQSILKPVNRVQFDRLPEKKYLMSSEKGDASSAGRETPGTPNSIDSEVNSYFRPIRSAPKTPPKRLADGTYLPEPVIVKTTPMKMRLLHIESEVSLELHMSPNKLPNKITGLDGKRISDDSGRASVSSFDSNNSVRIISDCDSGCNEKPDKPFEKDQDKPEINQKEVPKTPDIPILTAITDMSEERSSSPQSDNLVNSSQTPPILCYNGPSNSKGLETSKPNSPNDYEKEKIREEVEREIAWLMEEEKKDPSPSQDDRIDIEEVERQAQEFEKIRLRFLQEAEDRKLAKKLQKDLNTEKRADPYNLRGWLSQQNQNQRPRRSSRRST